jgi:5,10-methylenetetrahydromethanopterin reductase
MIELGIRLPPCRPPAETARAAREAEEAGFACGWVMDSQLLGGVLGDTYMHLAACAAVTRTLRLGPAVTNPFTRHATVTAAAMLTLEDAAPGRAVLGIGTGGSALRTFGTSVTRLGGSWTAGRQAVRETVGLLRDLCDGKTVALDGAPLRLPAPRPRIPVYVSATGERALELAGEIADGVIVQVGLHPAPLRWAIERVHRGAARAGRDPAAIRLVCSTFTSMDDDPARAVELAKPLAAWFYSKAPRFVEMAGFEVTQREPVVPVPPDLYHPLDHAAAVRAAAFVPDDAARALCLTGTPEACGERLRSLAGLGIHQYFLRDVETFRLPSTLIRLCGERLIPRLR